MTEKQHQDEGSNKVKSLSLSQAFPLPLDIRDGEESHNDHKRETMKRIIIMGASSGIGLEVARLYIERGYCVGVCARRLEPLEQLRSLAPERVYIRHIDVCSGNAPQELGQLIEEMGGLDIYLHSSGVGWQSLSLSEETSRETLEVNAVGFTRMIDYVFEYFARQGRGQLCAITSIAGTRGLGPAAVYSASKAYQACYLQALSQLLRIRELPEVQITEIRPGFVDTPLLSGGGHYPMLMRAEVVAQTIVQAINRGERVRTIDWRYRILVGLWRLVPRVLWERIALSF